MSSSIGFNVGSHFLLDARHVHVTRVVNGTLITLEDIESLALYQYSSDQLLAAWADERIKPLEVRDATPGQRPQPEAGYDQVPETYLAKARRKKQYIDRLLASGEQVVFTPAKLIPRLRQIAAEIGDPHPPGASTVHHWVQMYRRHGNTPRSLLDRFDTRGWYGCRFAEEIQEALLALIESRYLEPPGCTMISIHQALEAKVAELNLLRTGQPPMCAPGYHAVRRAILAYPAYDRAVARYGVREASIRFRTSLKGPDADYVLQYAEIDHTPVDLFVIDEQTSLPLGRPTLTLLIDRKSRVILGVYVSFCGPSTEAVFQCLRHAILPKQQIQQHYSRVEGEWPCHGLPQTLVCDNGLEFHSKALEQACFELGITLQFCPKRKPYFKGRVERAFRSITQSFLHVQPGTSLSNWMDRHGYDPLKTAVATFEEFMHALHIWIVDVYANTVHRGLKRTPRAVWQQGVLSNPPRLPDLHTLDLALMEHTERVLWHYGVELFNLRYNCHALYPIRHQLGPKVTVHVRYNRADIGRIYIIHPTTGEAILVPALEADYAAGLRLEVHQLILQDVRAMGRAEADAIALAQAKERIRQVIGESLGHKKLQRRKRAARLSGVGSQSKQRGTEASKRSNPLVESPKPAAVRPSTFEAAFQPWGRKEQK